MATPELHPGIAHLAFLVGTWRGEGAGEYPTIDSFGYLDELVFDHVGKPYLSYVQRTRRLDNNMTMHDEVGYLRPVGTDRVELVVAQPSGIVETNVGSIVAATLTLTSTAVAVTPTAKSVTEITRVFTVDGDTLTSQTSMAAVGQELQHHLASTLARQ